jgi:hypothetical protein
VGDDLSFHGSARGGRRSDGRIAALVVVLGLAFVGLAIAKPWGGTVQPPPSPPSLANVASPAATPAASLLASPPASPPAAGPSSPSATPSATADPLPVAFTTPLPPSGSTWTGLRWRRLAPDDPLRLVTSVTRWRHGYVAVGWIARTPATPVWTSADGSHWKPLIPGTATTFWPGLAVIGVAGLPSGPVAVTESLPYCGGPCEPRYVLPVVTWTSADGRRWTHRLLLPQESMLSETGAAPLVASGPAGLLLATSGLAAHLAATTDGTHWRQLPAGTLPAAFWLDDLRGTATGYLAVGGWVTGATHEDAAALSSADGRHWSQVPTLLQAPAMISSAGGSTVDSLVVGLHGTIAIGRNVTYPGAPLWWRSADGRRWQALPGFAPLGPARCVADGCNVQPDGSLVSDGRRMVALRGGPDAGAWTSMDGLAWHRLAITGDVPAAVTKVTLLPGGVMVSDGTTTWFGAAQGR